MDKTYKFDDFVLDLRTWQFFHKQEPVHIGVKAFNILLYLLQNRGRLVDKDELLRAVWNDSIVEESNLAVQICALRAVLGDKRGENQFIKTVSGRGYIFLAQIEETESEQSPVSVKSETKTIAQTDEKSLPKISGNSKDKEDISIAVLPFTAEDGDADFDYIASGITQSLIANISKIPGLKVMAYSAVSKYKADDTDIHEIGFLLGVDKVLLGRISKYKGNLDISVELINAMNRMHIWGTQYSCQFSDIFTVRKEISVSIAEQLKLYVTDSVKRNLLKDQTTSPAAYKLYLKGNYILETLSSRKAHEASMYQALGLFQEALKSDPGFALAYTGIGRVYSWLYIYRYVEREQAMSEAKRALQLALSLDDKLSDAYLLGGIIALNFDLDLPSAESAFKLAIEMNPNNALAFHFLAHSCACLKKFDEAVSYQNQALRFDPLSTYFSEGLIRIFYQSGSYNKAIIQAEETLALNPNSRVTFFLLAEVYAELEMYDEALINVRKSARIPLIPEKRLLEAYILARMGEHQKGLEIVAELLREADETNTVYSDIATVYSALGNTETALDYMDKAFDAKEPHLQTITVYPRLKGLRDQPRFTAIVEKLNLA